jgi:hypothetical protein
MTDNGTQRAAHMWHNRRVTSTGRCTACGCTVIWAHNPDGALVALDVRPHGRGTWMIAPNGTASYVGETHTDAIRYLPHQATCSHPSRGTRR